MKTDAAKPQGKPASSAVVMMSMLIVAVFFSMAARAIYSPLMPSIQRELNFSLATAGTLFLVVTVSFAPAILCSGFLSSRIGHGYTIVTALASLAAGLMLTAFAPGVTVLAAGMMLIGAGAGIYPPSGIVMINTRIKLEKQSTAFAFHEMGPNMALLISPLIVLILQPWFGWRGVLIWMSVICGASALAFWRWGAADSGYGSAPNLSMLGTLLRLRSTYVGMLVLSAALAGFQGIYAILPAYLAAESSFSVQHINILLTVSRIASVLLLFRAGSIIRRYGNRRTIVTVLLSTAGFTALLGIAKGPLVPLAVIGQPALLALVFPALLSSLSTIGEKSYQNVTYGLIITAGVTLGGGLAPALLGLFGDAGLGWLGFVALAGYMTMAVVAVMLEEKFGVLKPANNQPATGV